MFGALRTWLIVSEAIVRDTQKDLPRKGLKKLHGFFFQKGLQIEMVQPGVVKMPRKKDAPGPVNNLNHRFMRQGGDGVRRIEKALLFARIHKLFHGRENGFMNLADVLSFILVLYGFRGSVKHYGSLFSIDKGYKRPYLVGSNRTEAFFNLTIGARKPRPHRIDKASSFLANFFEQRLHKWFR
jgi:hypothetical protein